MKCAVCEREFTAQRKTRRFCSDRCRLRYHRPNLITKYNNLVDDFNSLLNESKTMCEKVNVELTRLYDQVDLLLAERALTKAAEEAAKKLIK